MSQKFKELSRTDANYVLKRDDSAVSKDYEWKDEQSNIYNKGSNVQTLDTSGQWSFVITDTNPPDGSSYTVYGNSNILTSGTYSSGGEIIIGDMSWLDAGGNVLTFIIKDDNASYSVGFTPTDYIWCMSYHIVYGPKFTVSGEVSQYNYVDANNVSFTTTEEPAQVIFTFDGRDSCLGVNKKYEFSLDDGAWYETTDNPFTFDFIYYGSHFDIRTYYNLSWQKDVTETETLVGTTRFTESH